MEAVLDATGDIDGEGSEDIAEAISEVAGLISEDGTGTMLEDAAEAVLELTGAVL